MESLLGMCVCVCVCVCVGGGGGGGDTWAELPLVLVKEILFNGTV